MLLIWLTLQETFYFFRTKTIVLFFLVCLGLRVYSSLLAGWRRVSKFASLGSIRSCSQSISYEVRMALFFISMVLFLMSIKVDTKKVGNLFFILSPLLLVWFLSCIAETNRAPFDFREGERELISGFNIEFGAVTFTLLFLAEYGIIIFFSFFSSIFFSRANFSFCLLFLFFFILIRRVYPRFRYDKLMQLTWILFLPSSLFFCAIVLLL